ncbi:uncharacterized protein LOC129307908 isoform X3 [Prosopis cineraria]|uniref:uncharacterized protein LOC129307908 isoform X3 n=1 Tax=Prosopis cineraria TaxID=364024 RepID=UPI00240F025C|nr:uncharacterized protein LOC129307908 isoform X3 [Prosopis cineraria]
MLHPQQRRNELERGAQMKAFNGHRKQLLFFNFSQSKNQSLNPLLSITTIRFHVLLRDSVQNININLQRLILINKPCSAKDSAFPPSFSLHPATLRIVIGGGRIATMPGPGPHMMYAMGSGLALTAVTHGRFSPHHSLTYALNAFFGPDIGSFSEWLASFVDDSSDSFASRLPDLIHHPLYYILILGLPLSFLYSWISKFLLQHQLLDSVPRVPLTRKQCFLLISAGSFSHFFLDHLFEENGHSTVYTWILSTGWWERRAPINPDAVVAVTFLCTFLYGGFFYINRPCRVNSSNSIVKRMICR